MEQRNNVRIWGLEGMDANTILQAEKTGRCPILAGPVALMPDAHLGIGATVGSVIVTNDALIPAAVGVDIGCGMIAVQTDLRADALPMELQPLVQQFGRSIPSGVGRGRDTQSSGLSDKAQTQRAQAWMDAHPHTLTDKLRETAFAQLGTLGSGNHFLETCLDNDGMDGEGRVWVVLHSGSRGVGNQLANQHIKRARDQKQGLEDPDLSYFTKGQESFDAYLYDMLWAQEYAYANRELMMTAALEDLFAFVEGGHEVTRINCHHNFAAQETHGGRTVWVTRKGAIRAQVGDSGIIPGSMATGTFITTGRGNLYSYNSSSHGAGRKLSRGAAKKQFTVESLNGLMAGKAWNSDQAQSLLDEHPDAYKDILAVMEAQADLTQPVHTLHQVLNYKGI